MADYSEFPTTPTGWQERQAQEWQTVTPLETEDAERPRQQVDLTALVPGVAFVVIAIVFMSGVHLPDFMWRNGGFLWVVLMGVGIVLLVAELRKARRRRS
ncbi:MAG TPA: hypothetical protein VK402_19810 [Blastococcus sp.]|nr:hypothetical protein [Blastococcus sp.]